MRPDPLRPRRPRSASAKTPPTAPRPDGAGGAGSRRTSRQVGPALLVNGRGGGAADTESTSPTKMNEAIMDVPPDEMKGAAFPSWETRR